MAIAWLVGAGALGRALEPPAKTAATASADTTAMRMLVMLIPSIVVVERQPLPLRLSGSRKRVKHLLHCTTVDCLA